MAWRWGLSCLVLLGLAASVDPATQSRSEGGRSVPEVTALPDGASPEMRLIHVYRLIGAGRSREALAHAEQLVRDEPTFRLAHLVYADLLVTRRLASVGFGGGLNQSVPGADAKQLDPLRQEALVRIQALKEVPPKGTVPRQLLALPATITYAMAVDASRSRLYLLEQKPNGLQLVANYYVSLGKFGIDKRAQGDQRTPTGVYFITSRLDANRLTDFYGSGALQLNYPNESDRREGRTGSGIWLHGVPKSNYAREPLATDGCVVLANEDLSSLMRLTDIGGTPVVIAHKLDWVPPQSLETPRKDAMNLVRSWHKARMAGEPASLASFYARPDVPRISSSARSSGGRKDRSESVKAERTELKDISVLNWHDSKDLMVVTFGEVPVGASAGSVIRQYWSREAGQWKIFAESALH
jgi:murein L,D-transpeptidase YafK